MKLGRNGKINMELDDFKNRNSRHNTIKSETGLINNSLMDVLIDSFKIEIKSQRKKSLIWISVLLMLGIIYLSTSARVSDFTSIGYHLTVIGFVLGGIYLYFRYRTLPDSIYTLPVLEFLDKAEKKIKFINLIDWLIIVPLLLMLGTGGGIIFTTRLLNYTDNITLLLIIWVIFFIALSIFGFVAGKKNWEKEHAVLLREFQKARESLMDTNNNNEKY
jgi:hypothetical protein